jgi:predicted nucleic acid-binding protein
MYLLDTNVVAEIGKVVEGKADLRVAAWQARVDTINCFISAVTLMELEIGVLRMERRDAKQGLRLRQWLSDQVVSEFDGRVLPIDAVVARRCAGLHVPNPRPERDALIAATALVHGMTVVTRNTADFEPAGVALLNPWQHGTLQEAKARYVKLD